MLVEVTDIEERGPVLEVEASLPYDEVARFDDPEYVLNKLRQKEASGTTSGSWLVANPVSQHNGVLPEPHSPEADIDRDTARRARYIEQGPLVSIADLDVEAGRVRFAAHKWASGGGEFGVAHRTPVGPDDAPGEWDVPFEPGDWFILDPNHDDVTSRREAAMLDDEDNDLCRLLSRAVRGDAPALASAAFDADGVEAFVEFLRAQHDAPVVPDPPNGSQAAFIRETARLLSLLQGPPGTGKTQTLGAAITARANAAGATGDSLVAGVVGPSNKAVDVAVESTAETLAYADAAASPGTAVDAADVTDTLLVRVVSSSYAADDDTDLPVVYMTPDFDVVDHGPLPAAVPDEALGGEIRRRLADPTPGSHVAVFGTSAGLQRLLGELAPGDDPLAQSVFNLVAADEASMLRLPGLLVPGGCLQAGAQVLVSGDQRQMPPVISHDWDAETRRNARELVPHLPSLDYLRLLGGHGVEADEFEGIDIADLAFEPDLDVPMAQLDVSYRCAPPCTAMLNRDVYAKKDGINYRTADEAAAIDPDDPPLANPDDAPLDREAAEAILDPDSPVVLVRHDEDASRQLNELEAAITESLADCLNGGGDGYGMGVVTPHNSQRSRLQMATRDRDWVTADTVERFQGDEEDVVVMSATESDPDYLTSQSEFILDQNRITVALSRMKHKLVIIASEEIFGLIPRDIDEYEDAELWKGLHAALADADAAWEGTADDLLGDDRLPDDADDASVSVFTADSADAFQR